MNEHLSKRFFISLALISFFTVCRLSQIRFFTISQILLLAFVFLETIIIAKRKVMIDINIKLFISFLYICILTFLLSTFVGSLVGTVDIVQGLRDTRDLFVFAICSSLLVLICHVSRQSPIIPLIVGGTIGMLTELSLRGTSYYTKLFTEPYYSLRFSAGFLGPNEYGAFASIIGAICFWIVISCNKIGKRYIFAIIGLIISIIILISTLSRGSTLGFIISIAITLCIWAYDVILHRNTSNSVILPIINIIIVLGIFVFLHINVTKASSYQLLTRFNQESLTSGVYDRKQLLQSALQIGIENPIIGAGMGAFTAQNYTYGGTGTLSPHNELVKAFADGGILGVISIFMILAIPLINSIKLRKKQFGYALLSGIIAFILAESFFSYLVRPGLSIVYAFLIASVFTQSSVQECHDTEHPTKK